MAMVRMGYWRAAALSLACALAGCSALDMGPEPGDAVNGGGRAKRMSDPELEAVAPVVAGDAGTEAFIGSLGTMPATMPAATQPGTTQMGTTGPATQPATGPTTQATNLPGRVNVPSTITVQDAIMVGLQNNSSLRVQRYNVPIARTAEEIQRAAFDPTVSGQVAGGRTAVPANVASGSVPATIYSDTLAGEVDLQEFLPTGTTVKGSVASNNTFDSGPSSTARVGVSVTQALLKGGSVAANLATLREARLDTKITQYELRGFAESLVANVEETYWDLSLAERSVVIVENALEVAEAQLRQTNELIKVQRLAESERAAAEAEVALRKEALIDAKSTLESTRLKFLQLIAPPHEPFWKGTVALQTAPFVPQGAMDPVERHVEVGLRLRPEINQTKLQIQRGQLEVVRTKNGLLPQLDLFLTTGKTGYASSFGNAVPNIDGPGYDVLVGVSGSYTLGNRAPRASYQAAVLTKEQSQESLENLTQTVQVDVRTAYIEVGRTRQQIDATKATRIAQAEALRVETEKFKLGRSTSLLVAQAQRDLLSAQLAEVQAVTGHLKALVELYRLEGSLLFRRGVEAPGAAPVVDRAK